MPVVLYFLALCSLYAAISSFMQEYSRDNFNSANITCHSIDFISVNFWFNKIFSCVLLPQLKLAWTCSNFSYMYVSNLLCINLSETFPSTLSKGNSSIIVAILYVCFLSNSVAIPISQSLLGILLRAMSYPIRISFNICIVFAPEC